MPKTKIVCTLGPSSSDPAIMERMVRAGMDVARVNLSHGTWEVQQRLIRTFREVARSQGRSIPVLVDLQGPKIRVGSLAASIDLVPGSKVVLAPEGRHQPPEIPTTYAFLAEDLRPGDRVLLDDGLLELVCRETRGDRAVMQVVRGGVLHPRKGINLPGVHVREPSLTPKDLEDLELALDEGVELMGLSFVRRPEDVSELKERVGNRAKVVAKIEKAEALESLDGILEATDMVMVARGDLGVELPFEEVPLAQKRIIRMANRYAKPVITATQMLDSMMRDSRPTRAEASDVANAILDGTDALMLAGETAMGRYPVEAVEALARIAGEIDRQGAIHMGFCPSAAPGQGERIGISAREHAVASASVESGRLLQAPAILVMTRTGRTAEVVSSYRPPLPIVAVCTEPLVHRQLQAVWGVQPVLAEVEEVNYASLTAVGRQAVMESGLGGPGDPVVVTWGYPFHTAGTTNSFRIESL
jgi:pyruvate kinase